MLFGAMIEFEEGFAESEAKVVPFESVEWAAPNEEGNVTVVEDGAADTWDVVPVNIEVIDEAFVGLPVEPVVGALASLPAAVCKRRVRLRM